MQPYQPMAIALEWLDAYRTASVPGILRLYDTTCSIECSCSGQATIVGKEALAAYWQRRFRYDPASEMTGISYERDAVQISYVASDVVVRAKLYLTLEGKIRRTVCGPAAKASVNA